MIKWLRRAWWKAKYRGSCARPPIDPDAIEHHVARDDEARAEGRLAERRAIMLFARREGAKKGKEELTNLADRVARGEHLA